MKDEDGEEIELPNIKKMKLEMFEMSDPEGAERLKRKVEKKLRKTKEEITKMVEKEIEDFIEKRNLETPKRSYLG